MPTDPTDSDVLVLSRRDPLVAAAIGYWHTGAIPTWDAALRTMVIELAKQNEELRERLADCEPKRPREYIIEGVRHVQKP